MASRGMAPGSYNERASGEVGSYLLASLLYNLPIVMSNQPPTYEAATGGLAPSINPSSGSAHQSTSAEHASRHSHGPRHHDYEDDSSEDEMDSDGMLQPLRDDVEARKSMSDEYRELPEGWVRCFDKK